MAVGPFPLLGPTVLYIELDINNTNIYFNELSELGANSASGSRQS